MFTRACHMSLSEARCMKLTRFHPTSLRSFLILSSNLHSLPRGLFLSDFCYKTLQAFHFLLIFATCPTHHILNSIIQLLCAKDYKSWSSLQNFLYPCLTFSVLGPKIFLSSLFSNTPSPCSSLNVKDQVSHSQKTTGKITVLQLLISWISTANQKRKNLDLMVADILQM